MSFSAKLVPGGLRYRAARALESILQFPSQTQRSPKSGFNDAVDTSVGSRLRQHPFFLSLPALALPSQLDRAAINYLREHSLSPPKAIEDRAEMLRSYLWSRPLMSESQVIERQIGTSEGSLRLGPVEETDPDLAQVVQYHNFDRLANPRPRATHKIAQECLEQWKSLTYSAHNCELYLTARLAPNFAATCRVLYEIRKRCPQFIPRNLFDFGSGLGTVTWAVNTVWPVGCVSEHYMVEPSADMTAISEFMLRKNLVIRSPETIFPGIYHRRFMPMNKKMYDLVVSAHSLLELPGRLARERVLSNLWGRTSDFLVLIEQGTKAGFAGILEARDWLLKNGGEDVCVFAPCPHHHSCGKSDSICNISVRYYHFGLTREKNEPQTELISYLIVSRGNWRRHQTPAVEAESHYLPRLVSFQSSHGGHVTHDICLPSGVIERADFSKRQTDKSLYYFLRNAQTGDIVPCEPVEQLDSKPEKKMETDES